MDSSLGLEEYVCFLANVLLVWPWSSNRLACHYKDNPRRLTGFAKPLLDPNAKRSLTMRAPRMMSLENDGTNERLFTSVSITVTMALDVSSMGFCYVINKSIILWINLVKLHLDVARGVSVCFSVASASCKSRSKDWSPAGTKNGWRIVNLTYYYINRYWPCAITAP